MFNPTHTVTEFEFGKGTSTTPVEWVEQVDAEHVRVRYENGSETTYSEGVPQPMAE